MRYGRLDRLITIQRKTLEASPSGEPIETWSNLAARRWASVSPVRGDERFADPQLVAQQQTEFQVRWSDNIADLRPLDRIVYPAVADASPPPAIAPSTIYDIISVDEVGRREGFRIITKRRPET